jgi:hypothetical protein
MTLTCWQCEARASAAVVLPLQLAPVMPIASTTIQFSITQHTTTQHNTHNAKKKEASYLTQKCHGRTIRLHRQALQRINMPSLRYLSRCSSWLFVYCGIIPAREIQLFSCWLSIFLLQISCLTSATAARKYSGKQLHEELHIRYKLCTVLIEPSVLT